MSHLARTLNLIQLAIGAILIVAILTQNRGAGLSNVFGGSGAIYRTKRGFEKWLFYATIILSICFIGLSLAVILSSRI